MGDKKSFEQQTLSYVHDKQEVRACWKCDILILVWHDKEIFEVISSELRDLLCLLCGSREI